MPAVATPGLFAHKVPMAANEPARPKLWHCVDDVYRWLETHPQVSGVQRVALALLAASRSAKEASGHADDACVLAPSGRWLAPLDAERAMADFAPWLESVAAKTPVRHPAEGTLLWPAPGEQVLFAGLAWTPPYRTVFRRLHAFGIPFGVLLHDIIPLTRPDLVPSGEPAAFKKWLRTVLLTADHVFVSTDVTASALRDWSRHAGIVGRATAHAIPFGVPREGAPGRAVRRPPSLPENHPAGFVLSVGTIDRRKNQAMLLDVWESLAAEIGVSALPVLVLAGRPNLPGLAERSAGLAAAGKFVLLPDAADAELAWAYRHCRFTLFPSLAEGYGLPVLESLAAERCCIASDLPEIREIAGERVRLCPPQAPAAWAEAVRDMIAHPPSLPPLWLDRPRWTDSLAAIREAMASRRV